MKTRKQQNIEESKKFYTNLLNKAMGYPEDLRNEENIKRYSDNIKKLEAM